MFDTFEMAEDDEACTLVARGKLTCTEDEFVAPLTTATPHVQGYDYEFVPTLDSKYECPICLLCQRNPTQTTCGHRFCKDCILTWISKEQSRCPEDNSPITKHDLFPDNFAKREIMSLIVRCPNVERGCLEIFELGKVEDHRQMCEFELITCPSNCGMRVTRKTLESHIAEDCVQRKIRCKLCHMDFLLKELEAHFMECPMVTVPCEQCTELLSRHKLQLHIDLDCPRTKLSCPFHEIGCNERLERKEMEQHDKTNMHLHLQLLTSAFQAFKYNVGSLLQGNDHSRSGSVKARLTDDTNTSKMEEILEKSDCHYFQMKFEDGEDRLSSNMPASLEKFDNTCFEKKYLSWMPSPSETIRDLYQRNVQLEQKSREQEIRIDALRQKVSECEKSIGELIEEKNLFETRFCNGIYIWHVYNFSRLQREAAHGHNRVLHSPGFYTSCFGYKVCLRLNIQGKHNMNVSLFIHLMQGEYDGVLNWPFIGKIVLSILDQKDRSETGADITETMLTKPGLTAFRRPVTERNPKGFGYTEFVSVDTLLAGPYLKDDQLIIKAVVSL